MHHLDRVAPKEASPLISDSVEIFIIFFQRNCLLIQMFQHKAGIERLLYIVHIFYFSNTLPFALNYKLYPGVKNKEDASDRRLSLANIR